MDPSSQHAQMRHTEHDAAARVPQKHNVRLHIGDPHRRSSRYTTNILRAQTLVTPLCRPSLGLLTFGLFVSTLTQSAGLACATRLQDAGLGLQMFGTSHFTPGEGGDGKRDMAIRARGQPLRWPRLDPQRGGCWNRLRGYSGRRGRCWCFKCIAAACAVSALSPGCVL